MGLLIDSKGTVHHNALGTVQVDCPTTVAALTAGAGEVGTTELATGAVTAVKLASDAVTTVKILDANVTTGKLAAGAVTLPKITTTGIKVLAGTGVNSGGGDAQATFTGTVIGDRVVAIFGAPTAGGTMEAKVPGTDFEAAVTVTNKIVQKQAAGDLSTKTYIAILFPATA